MNYLFPTKGMSITDVPFLFDKSLNSSYFYSMNEPKKKRGYNKGYDNLKPAKKGEPSRNPKGRPKKEFCIPDILRRIADEPCSRNEKITNLEMVCSVAFDNAIKGDAVSRAWIADRMEGRAIERIIARDGDAELTIE